MRILRSFVWRTSSEVCECTEIAKLLGVLCQRYSAGRALRECADSQEKELCEFYHLKEASTEGVFIGLLNTPKDSARRRLRKRIAGGVHIPICGRKRRRKTELL